jgi:hypothetical protein
MNELAKIETPKGLTMPCRTVPEAMLNTQIAFLLHTMEVKLGIKDTDENRIRIKALFEEVKKSAWGLSVEQMLKGFDLYINGKLSYNGKLLEPISGYLDIVLFKKIIQSYKEQKSPPYNVKSIVLAVWEHWKENKNLEVKGIIETFEYLYDKGLLPKKGVDEKVDEKYNSLMKSAQGYLWLPLWEKSKWFEKEDLADTPKYKELKEEMQTIKEGTHTDLMEKFKSLVLEGYFKKLKRDLNEII